jgi:hypothetical protein
MPELNFQDLHVIPLKLWVGPAILCAAANRKPQSRQIIPTSAIDMAMIHHADLL